MRVRTIYFMLILIVSTSGCATIICGKHQTIPISSSPSGAKITADDGTTITTPGALNLSRKDEHTLVAEYPGYESQQIKLSKRLNNWIWAGILLDFGIISIPTDFVTGAANELEPKEVHFTFAPKDLVENQ